MARLRFTAIPTPADAEDDLRIYAVAKQGEYAGWVETSRAQNGWMAYRSARGSTRAARRRRRWSGTPG